jgi:hypothetical protein
MDKNHWNNSFLKEHWFRNERSLPKNAVEEVSRQALLHYQRVAGVAETLSHSFWHRHAVLSDVWSRQCPTCQTFVQLRQHLHLLFADIDGIVVDFFDEPEHHGELEIAVRLYSFSLLLVLSGHIVRGESELLEYAESRIEELHGLSLVRKGREKGSTSTSDAEKQFLVGVFIEVYKGIRDELDAWNKKYPLLPLPAFPALSGTALLHKQSTHEWSLLPASSIDECVVSLPLYEWDLLALLLKESAVHASWCSFLWEASAGAPQWIPNTQQSWDEQKVTQPRLIWKGLVDMLLRISNHMADHGCDDVPFSQWVPDTDQRRALMKRYHDWNSDPEVFLEDEQQGATYEIEHCGVLVWYMARRIGERLTP